MEKNVTAVGREVPKLKYWYRPVLYWYNIALIVSLHSCTVVLRSHFSLFFLFFAKIFGVSSLGVLLWLRIDWGFEEWIHEVTYYNFWNGAYILMSGSVLLCINCGFGIRYLKRCSVRGMVVVSNLTPE
jgi:hypothetical protein